MERFIKLIISQKYLGGKLVYKKYRQGVGIFLQTLPIGMWVRASESPLLWCSVRGANCYPRYKYAIYGP